MARKLVKKNGKKGNPKQTTETTRKDLKLAYRPRGKTSKENASKTASASRNEPGALSSPPVKKDVPFKFLELPAEIKNRIYDLVFEPRRVEIMREKGRSAMESEEDGVQRKGRVSRKLTYRPLFTRGKDHIVRPAMRRNGPKPNTNLLFLNKQMYAETLLYLYSTTYFVFKSSKALRRFLKHIPYPARRSIRYLELHHSTYGEPMWLETRAIKIRSDERWVQTCLEIRDTFTMLKELYVNFHICDWPFHLELTEDWARSLLCFVGLELEYASIELITKAFHEVRLKLVGDLLENLIMSDEGYAKKTRERHEKNAASLLNIKV